MHILSTHYRSEFLAVPQLVRFAYPYGSESREPTFLIKVNSLIAKSLLRGAAFEVIINRLEDARILYAARIFDDLEKPATIWSILQRREERTALNKLLKNGKCQVFLFNELAINVAWAEVNMAFKERGRTQIFKNILLDKDRNQKLPLKISELLDSTGENIADRSDMLYQKISDSKWNIIRSTYITNSTVSSLLDLSEKDEGGQQEELILWLTDNLHVKGAIRSPRIHVGVNGRELTDVLLSYENGSFLFESKSLNILTRSTLPNRSKLESDVVNHISKATKQLAGAIRQIKSGAEIFNKDSQIIEVNRENPAHAIILISDLSLLHKEKSLNKKYMSDFYRKTRSFIHILDPSELLRIVQGAEMVASKKVSHMMAFDFLLMERFKFASKNDNLYVQILHNKELSSN